MLLTNSTYPTKNIFSSKLPASSYSLKNKSSFCLTSWDACGCWGSSVQCDWCCICFYNVLLAELNFGTTHSHPCVFVLHRIINNYFLKCPCCSLSYFKIDYFSCVLSQCIHDPIQSFLVADIGPHFIDFIFFSHQDCKRPGYGFCKAFDAVDDRCTRDLQNAGDASYPATFFGEHYNLAGNISLAGFV